MGGEGQVSMQVAADMDLAHESGLQLQARSQWSRAMRRLLRHRLAMGSLVVLLFLGIVAIFADFFALPVRQADFLNVTQPPTLEEALLRHRLPRPRHLQPCHLRDADVTLGGARGLPARDGDRHDDRRRRRLLRRLDRQRADAAHGPRPDAPGSRQRCSRSRSTWARASRVRRRHLRAPLLDGVRAHRPRHVPVAAGEGVRRERPRPRARATGGS